MERVCPLRHCPYTAGSYLGARPPRAVLAPLRRPDQGHLPKVGMRRVAVVFVLVRAAVCVAAEPGVPLTIPGSGSLIVPSPTVAELACYASHPMLEIFTDKRVYGSSLRFAGLPTPSLPGATDGFAPHNTPCGG